MRVLALAAPLVFGSGAVWAGGDPEVGKKVAVEVCARCHVVSDEDLYTGIDSTPKFQTFAAKPETYPPRRIRTFDERPPHPPQELDVSDDELEDLIAYIRTLREE